MIAWQVEALKKVSLACCASMTWGGGEAGREGGREGGREEVGYLRGLYIAWREE